MPENETTGRIQSDSDAVTVRAIAKWGPHVAGLLLAVFTFGVTWARTNTRVEAIERDVATLAARAAAQDSTTSRVIGLESQLGGVAAARSQDKQLLEQLVAHVEKLDRRIALLVCKQDRTHCNDQ